MFSYRTSQPGQNRVTLAGRQLLCVPAGCPRISAGAVERPPARLNPIICLSVPFRRDHHGSALCCEPAAVWEPSRVPVPPARPHLLGAGGWVQTGESGRGHEDDPLRVRTAAVPARRTVRAGPQAAGEVLVLFRTACLNVEEMCRFCWTRTIIIIIITCVVSWP